MNILHQIRLNGVHTPSKSHSLYLPGKFEIKNKEQLLDVLAQHKSTITRIHIPPDRNFKNLDNTIDFLKFLHSCLRKLQFDGQIGIDIHTGHDVSILQIKNRASILANFLSGISFPELYVSVENVFKSGLSSKHDVLELLTYIRDSNLNRIKVTVDHMDFEKSEGKDKDHTILFLKELQSLGLSDFVNCIHAPSNYTKTIQANLDFFAKRVDFFQVLEGESAN